MLITNKSKSFAFTFIAIIIACLFILAYTPDNLSVVLVRNWYLDIFCLLVSSICMLRLNAKGKCDLLSAPFFVGVVYIIMFFITPLYDIYIGETTIFEAKDLFDYGIEGSIVALISFVCFCFIFDSRYKASQYRPTYSVLTEHARKKVERIVLIFWVVEFVVGMICVIVTQGFSISYILTFGLVGDADFYESSNSLLGFIAQFTRGVVPLSIMLFAISKRKALVYTILLLTAMFEVINGFRYMIVIMVCGFFYFHYISQNKKVSPTKLLTLVLGLCFIVGIVGFSRNSVRTGAGFDSEGFGIDSIIDALLGNFRIYKSYYAVIKAVPTMTPYLYFDQMLFYTLIMAIPRMLWPGKPLNPGTAAQYYGMGQSAVDSGYAYPNLGEYYYSFGFIGCVFFMGWFAWWLAKMTTRYRNNAHNIIEVVWFCITVPLTLQLLIRGYTPSNFYLIIALFFPCWYINRYISKLKKPYIQ